VIEAMHVVSENNSFHPVRDYLNGLQWDGKSRIEKLLCAMTVGIDDYHKAAIKYFLISSVSRIFKPACKVDMMLILESLQGLGKSTFFRILFGEWYAEVTSSLNDKDFFMGLRGVWGADFGELDQFNKADSTRIKQILTMTDDHYRPAYARLAQKFPRQCVFIGGTNRDDWQKDETGGRRFLPMRIKDKICIEWLSENRDQIWAEAVQLMNQGGEWWEIVGAEEHQKARYVGDSWGSIIADYLFVKSETSTEDILLNCLKIEVGKHTRADATRVGQIMASQHPNWIKKQVMKNGISSRIFKKI
jgi:putative DNA primase/helicase